MSNIIDLNGNPAVKPLSLEPSLATAENVETTGEAAVELGNLKLSAFPDGFIFKVTEHPTEKDKFVLFDTQSRPIAVLESLPIAELICQSLRMVFAAVALNKSEEAKAAAPVMES